MVTTFTTVTTVTTVALIPRRAEVTGDPVTTVTTVTTEATHDPEPNLAHRRMAQSS